MVERSHLWKIISSKVDPFHFHPPHFFLGKKQQKHETKIFETIINSDIFDPTSSVLLPKWLVKNPRSLQNKVQTPCRFKKKKRTADFRGGSPLLHGEVVTDRILRIGLWIWDNSNIFPTDPWNIPQASPFTPKWKEFRNISSWFRVWGMFPA